MLKPLPTSTATFRDIIGGGYLYIDKTRFIYEVAHKTKGAYFFARPRRFGKSLFLSTLSELFRNNRDLFQGLWIDQSDYVWEEYPVIHLTFSLFPSKSAEALEDNIKYYLLRVAQEHGVALADGPYYAMFDELIYQLSQDKQVIILIDEYDKPLLDNLDNPAEAQKIRDILKGFYAVIKGVEQRIRLVFITGVSKFSKVSIFSELNHLTDLTMRDAFATALGITETELRTNFDEHISVLAKTSGMHEAALLEKIRRWYNGFRFAAAGENVYNPFSLMQLFDAQQFANYWFESGTPTFLINLIKERQYDLLRFQNMQVREAAFSTYEVENLAITPLLYQTGYLTIKDYDAASRRYTLAYPNQEVEESFLLWLMSAYSYVERSFGEAYLWEFVDALEAQNLAEMFDVLGVFFANIPYDLHVKHEKYYQTIFYLIFMLMGFRVAAEVQTNQGRIDAVVELTGHIYLFEFKLDKSADVAMAQVEDHAYYQKYRRRGKPVTYIGANFNSTTRQVDEWRQKQLD
ncbi:MAG: AAA family ATPase [Caldilineaceae bacterium]